MLMENSLNLRVGYADHEYNNEKPAGYLYGDRIRQVSNRLTEIYGEIILDEIKPTRWDNTSMFTQDMLERLGSGGLLITHVPPLEIELPSASELADLGPFGEKLNSVLAVLGDPGSDIYANSLMQLYPLWEAGVKIIAYTGAEEEILKAFDRIGIFPAGSVIQKTTNIDKDIKSIKAVIDRIVG